MSSYDDLPRRRRGPSSSYAGSNYAQSNISGSTLRGDPRDDRYVDHHTRDADHMTPEQQAMYDDLVRRENENLDREYERAMQRRVRDSTGVSEAGRSRRSQTSQRGFLGDDDLYPGQPREGPPLGQPAGSLHRRSTRGTAVVPYEPRGWEPPVDDYDRLMTLSANAHRRRIDAQGTLPVGDHDEPAPGVIARQSTVRTFPDGSQETTTTDFYSGSQRPRSSRDR